MEEHTANEYRQQRIINMKKLADAGFSGYGDAFERSARIDQLLEKFNIDDTILACGRILTMRKMGKMAFVHIGDGSSKIQLMIQRDAIGEENFSAFKLLDIGDFIGVEGTYFLTKTEEKTIKVKEWKLLAKALLPLPEKFHGLSNKETRYRQRSLDLISNSQTMDIFKKRTKIIREIRKYLDELNYLEVETPMLHQIPGGATAQPFKSHYNALDIDVFMRIAPELYLKRLIVGGMDRVYEINRNFRNEGVDRTHNPEFTCLELYQAYGDVKTMKNIIQGLLIHIAENIFNKTEFDWLGNTIDLALPWKEISYKNLISENLGAEWFNLDKKLAIEEANKRGVEVDNGMNHRQITYEIYEKSIECTLIQPTFVTKLPAELVPLAKTCYDDESYVDVFELIIGGKEIAPAYSELNDPIEQRNRLLSQANGELSKIDYDFLLALEHGMPPTGGMGIGIDRLVMFFTGADSIRDVILFPQLKPRQS